MPALLLVPALLVGLFLLLAPPASAQRLSSQGAGEELRQWHPLSLTFDGPVRSEEASTFTDFRFTLHVTTPSGQQLAVPGFFAADGEAANSSAESGAAWRAYVLPRETGRYRYEVSFRCGPNVAVRPDAEAGQPCAFDGRSGTFEVAPPGPEAPGHYARGLLTQEGRLMRFDSGALFVKGGADSPENLFAYADFDNTYNAGGDDYVRAYRAHVQDWEAGDPTWCGGDTSCQKGKGLIGALNYLASEGMNAFSFLPMNVQGDGNDVWPWTAPDEHLTYDVSKLAQWERVFTHADRLGLFIHFKTQETENDGLLGGLSDRRKLYYRELVARFSHHPALNWNLGEENTNIPAERRAFARYVKQLDPYDHPVVVHTYPGDYEKVYADLLGFEPFDGISVQLADMTDEAAWRIARDWLARSKEAGDPWACSLDEPGTASEGVYEGEGGANDGNLPEARAVMYASYLAGCYGTEWYFGYSKPHNDLNLTSFRSRDAWWDQVDVALQAMENFYEAVRPVETSSRKIDGGYALVGERPDGTARAMVYLRNGTSPFGASYEDVTYVNPRTGEHMEARPVGSDGLEAPFPGDALALLIGRR